MSLTADLNTNARRFAERLVNGVLNRFSPTRRAERQAGLVADALLKRSKDWVAQRSASVPEPIVPGTGKSWSGHQVSGALNDSQQHLLGSRDARYGRAFSRTGPTPRAFASHPEITLDYIARVHTHVERNGWMWDKADLDARILREHERLQPAERSRRAWIFQSAPRLLPRNDSTLALLVRNAVEAVLDDIDGFDSSVSELQVANGSGGALSELVWKQKPLRVVVGPKKATLVLSECVASLESIPLRSSAFDIDTDHPYVNQGNWGWVNPFTDPWTSNPLRKVVLHRGYGDGDTRMRGYGFAAHHLHWMSKLGWECSGQLMEVYGRQTPYLQPEDDGTHIRDEDLSMAEQLLADLGKGIPIILSRRLGKVELTPVPASISPIHQAMIGYCNTGLSMLVTGQTLAMEVGNVGSYNASDTHADSQEAVQRIDSGLTCASLNAQLLRFVVELNAEAWARAFARYCAGEECTPRAILQCVPRIVWDVSRKLTKPERLKMFIDANNSGLLIDSGQVYEECGFRPALSPDSAFGAGALTEPKPQPTQDQPPTKPRPAQPSPAPENAPPPRLELTATDLGTIITVNEARASKGLAPLELDTGEPDPDGGLTIAEFKAKHSAVISDAAAAEDGQAPPPPSDLSS